MLRSLIHHRIRYYLILRKIEMTPWVKWSESSDLCFKFSSAESSYSISFTNLSCVWKEEKTDDEISQKSENLNPSIEASNKRITSIVGSVVNDEKARQSSYVYLSEDGNRKLVIKMEQRLENLPFVWEFEPELQTKEQLKEDIVLPLLYSLVEMEYRERELIHIIKRKDAEIEDYKATGAKVSRKQLETKPFEESKFGESLSGIHRVGLQSPSDIFSKSSPNIFCKISRLIV
ncbi:hypothetical protein QYM36_012019, partial [Artemia franciscana]